MMTSAISSAIEPSAFWITSMVTGSAFMTPPLPGLPVLDGVPVLDGDDDVGVGVEPGPPARRHHRGGVVFLDDQRPGPLAAL